LDFEEKRIPELKKEQKGKAVDISLLAIVWDSTLVIYHPQQFFHPPDNSYSMILHESPLGSDPDTDCRDSPIPGIYKYGSLQVMLETIDFFLIHHPDFSLPNKKSNLMCVLGNTCPALRQTMIGKMKQEKQELGFKVVQIDFCPPYFCDYPAPFPSGLTLSDAFLRLMADDLSYEDLGTFLSPGADGTLQFRPIERADDLFECKPEHVRQFMERVLKWIAYTNSQYYVFVQCFAVPFSFIYTIATGSDELLLINQEDSTSRTLSYNKEVSCLLANLPGSCSMREVLVPCPAFRH